MVAVYGYRRDEKAKLATLRLDADGSVLILDAEERTERFLRAFRCFADEDGPCSEPLRIEDGERWLRVLPINLRGSYTWAEWTSPEHAVRPARSARLHR